MQLSGQSFLTLQVDILSQCLYLFHQLYAVARVALVACTTGNNTSDHRETYRATTALASHHSPMVNGLLYGVLLSPAPQSL